MAGDRQPSGDDVPPVVEVMIQENRDLEATIRETLRTSTQYATLSTAVLGAAATYISSTVGVGALCLLPVFLTIVALGHLNAAIEVAQLAEIRDHLSERINQRLEEPLFLVGQLAPDRRLAPAGLSVNVLSLLVLTGSIVLGLVLAWDRPWWVYQVAGTLTLLAFGAASIWDYATIRRRSQEALRRAASREDPLEVDG